MNLTRLLTNEGEGFSYSESEWRNLGSRKHGARVPTNGLIS